VKIRAGTVIAGVGVVVALVIAYRLIKGGTAAAAAVGETAAKVGQAINPLNPGNVFAAAANAAVQAATGDPNETLGGWVYGKIGPNRDAGAIATAPSILGPRPVSVSAGDLAATFDREDAEMGALMRQFEYFNAVDTEDRLNGPAGQGGAYLDYSHLLGRRK